MSFISWFFSSSTPPPEPKRVDEDLSEGWEVVAPYQVSSADAFLKSEVVRQELGTFSKEQLIAFGGMHKEGYTEHFSSFNDRITYPYEVQGVVLVDCQLQTEALFNFFARKVVKMEGQTPFEVFQKCMDGKYGPLLERKALHVSAFLKLIGDQNTVITTEASGQLVGSHIGLAVDPIPVTNGKIQIDIKNFGRGEVGYEVADEVVALHNLDQFDKPQEEREHMAHYQTTRSVVVSMPDQDGAVHYRVERTFTRVILDLSLHIEAEQDPSTCD